MDLHIQRQLLSMMEFNSFISFALKKNTGSRGLLSPLNHPNLPVFSVLTSIQISTTGRDTVSDFRLLSSAPTRILFLKYRQSNQYSRRLSNNNYISINQYQSIINTSPKPQPAVFRNQATRLKSSTGLLRTKGSVFDYLI